MRFQILLAEGPLVNPFRYAFVEDGAMLAAQRGLPPPRRGLVADDPCPPAGEEKPQLVYVRHTLAPYVVVQKSLGPVAFPKHHEALRDGLGI